MTYVMYIFRLVCLLLYVWPYADGRFVNRGKNTVDVQGKRRIKVGLALGLSLGAIVGLIGCSQQPAGTYAETGSHYFGLASANGLAGVNGLAGANDCPIGQTVLSMTSATNRSVR